MVARGSGVFTTDQVARLIGLDSKKDKWRVIKFAQGDEYGLKSSVSPASGSGTRRLYNLEDVCEFAIALRLLETGLRSKAIGKVIRELRKVGPLNSKLELSELDLDSLLLAIVRTPEVGRALDEKRKVAVSFVRTIGEAGQLHQKRPGDDLILVPMGSTYFGLQQRLQQLQG